MRPLFRCLLTSICLLDSVIVARAAQIAPKSPANEDCMACHADPAAKRADGRPINVDASAFDASKHGPMACVDCHADLAAFTDFPHADKLKKVNCASCHDAVGATYHDSIHARAREKSGLNVAPACADCHGRHDIKGKDDPKSRVSHAQIPVTCGACHEGIKQRYDAGVHATALRKGDSRAPVCADCHTAHSIQRADTDAWRLSVTAECGSCHVESARTFLDTFHGQVTALGYTRVAACADCHGAHDIFPKADSRSTVSPARIVQTCRRCHQSANAGFVQYDPHADRSDKARNSTLYYAARFMNVLLLGVFGFFGLHTALWLPRALKSRRETRR
jgi:hypothetical protein